MTPYRSYEGFQIWYIYIIVNFSLRFRIAIGRSGRPSVRQSVGPSVPCYLRTWNMAVFESNKSSNDIMVNHKLNDDEAVVSDVPQLALGIE